MCKSEQMMSCDCGHRGIKLEIADIILSPISLRVTAAILGFFYYGDKFRFMCRNETETFLKLYD